MFRKAVEWELVGEETLKHIRKVKYIKENNRRLRYLSKEECQALIDACEPHLKPIVITALNIGMRKSEILNFRWDDVDLRHGFISLNQSKTKNAKLREITINKTLRVVLQGLTRRLDIPYVLYNNATGRSFGEVRNSFQAACRRAGIRDFVFHDLRHTFVSNLVMVGVDITAVKELIGHKALTMTLRYAHLAPSHEVRALDILNDTLAQKVSFQRGKNHTVITIL